MTQPPIQAPDINGETFEIHFVSLDTRKKIDDRQLQFDIPGKEDAKEKPSRKSHSEIAMAFDGAGRLRLVSEYMRFYELGLLKWSAALKRVTKKLALRGAIEEQPLVYGRFRKHKEKWYMTTTDKPEDWPANK